MSICQKCGQPLAEGAKFCTNCGNVVPAPAASKAEPAAAQANQYTSGQSYTTGTQGQYNQYNQQNQYNPQQNRTYGQYANPQTQTSYIPTAPAYTAPAKTPVTAGGYILRSLLNLIPVVGWLIYFIMLFVWANDQTKEDSFRGWAKAQLILIFIGIGIAIIFAIIAAVAGVGLLDALYY